MALFFFLPPAFLLLMTSLFSGSALPVKQLPYGRAIAQKSKIRIFFKKNFIVLFQLINLKTPLKTPLLLCLQR